MGFKTDEFKELVAKNGKIRKWYEILKEGKKDKGQRQSKCEQWREGENALSQMIILHFQDNRNSNESGSEKKQRKKTAKVKKNDSQTRQRDKRKGKRIRKRVEERKSYFLHSTFAFCKK